jgi:tetratricopeptide (TPR) repeat protein
MKKALSWSAILIFLATNVAFGQIPNESDLSNTNGYYYNLLSGKTKADKGDFDGAVILLTKAIKIKPGTIDAYGYRGWAEYSKGDYDKAITDYTKCIELQPDNFSPYMYRGWAKQRKGDHNGAIADYTKIIEHETEPTALFNDAFFNRGEAKMANGDFDGAIVDLTKAIELGSAYYSAYMYRSDAKKAKGDLAGALADCNKAIESDVNLAPQQSAEAYAHRGCVYYDQHSFTNALIDFEKSREFNSSDDIVHFRIWLVQARLDEKETATRDLQKYLQSRQNEQLDNWQGKIGSFLTGDLIEGVFLKSAKNADEKAAASQMCQAYFYAGTKHLIEGDKKTAVAQFKKCLATNKIDFGEFWSAAAELKILQSEK